MNSLFTMTVCAYMAAASLFNPFKKPNVEAKPIEEEPMIDRGAVSEYEAGEITRDEAMERIDSRLNALKTMDAITDWEYEDSRYLIYMNNGVLFTFYLE